MFEVSVTQDFSAAHKLNNYEGPCSNIHGHTWKVKVSVCSNNLNKSGMVIDFKDLKFALLTIINRYDHGYINEISPFDKINPTAEHIARVIYQELKSMSLDCVLKQVTVWESENSCATYWED
jgi:6-pyruvoyltetrahydropterin/6-carboxytetrahydropterin synthase